MAFQRRGKTNLFGESVCVVCDVVIKQSGVQGRVRKYCSNRCKMKARYRRVSFARRQLTLNNRLKSVSEVLNVSN
jgi:hypothetical protein